MRRHSRLNKILAAQTMQPVTAIDQIFIDRAASLATASRHPYQRMAALYVKKRKIVTEANNSIKTHPQQRKWAEKSKSQHYKLHSLHAELAAAIAARQTLINTTLYVVRLGKDAQLRCSFPCEICYPFLQHIGVQQIVCYNTDDQPVKIYL